VNDGRVLYVVYNLDAPGTATLRQQHREAHLRFMQELKDAGKVKIGGPFLSEDGKQRLGGMYILDVPSIEDAIHIANQDPFVKAGLYPSTQVRPWIWQTGRPESESESI